MRARKWLMTTFMCGGLIFASGIANDAGAVSGRLLQPNSDWTVSKLSSAQTGGNPYCALARRFTNNLILTLARNAGDETSIALDFQKSTLNNAQTYFVTLKPGFGQDRSFKVRPVSGKALVIRIGKDYAFHDALNRSGQLAVDISGESYAFNLPNFSDGQHKLGECLANLVEPAAGPGMTAEHKRTPLKRSLIPASGNSDSNNISRAPVTAPAPQDTLKLQALREENMRLRNALERERRIYEDRYMEEGESSSRVAELSEKVELLQMENRQLRDQIAYKPVPKQKTCPKPEMPDLTANIELEKELSALRNDNRQLREEITSLQAKTATLRQELAQDPATSSAEKAVIESLRERVAWLEEKNNELKTKSSPVSAGSDNSIPVSLAKLRTVEEKLRQVQLDRDKLLRKLDAVNHGRRDGLLDISTDNWNLEKATKRFNEAEREIRRLARELEEQRMQCAVEKKELEYMLFDPSVASQEQIAKLTSLEKEVRQAQMVLDEQKAEYEQKLAVMENKLEESRYASVDPSELEAIRNENDHLNQKVAVLEQERNELADQAHYMNQKIASLESSLSDIQTASGPASLPPPVASEPIDMFTQGSYGDADTREAYKSFGHSVDRTTATAQNQITVSVLETLLVQAGVGLQKGIQRTDDRQRQDFVAFSWDTDNLFGSAEQQPMAGIAQFDDLAASYLEKTRQRCQGDFASVPASAEQKGGVRVSTYEIACVSGQNGATASIVFHGDGAFFTAIAHETGLENMATVMDIRDNLVGSLLQTQIASK